MIRLQEIQAALLPVVGWQQDYNPQNQIDDALCVSESGLTFQGAHPLCTLGNVRAIMPDDYLYQYSAWTNTTGYAIGAKVKHGGKIWVAKNANTGSEPAANNPDWKEYNPGSDFVRNLTMNGINTTVRQLAFVSPPSTAEIRDRILKIAAKRRYQLGFPVLQRNLPIP